MVGRNTHLLGNRFPHDMSSFLVVLLLSLPFFAFLCWFHFLPAVTRAFIGQMKAGSFSVDGAILDERFWTNRLQVASCSSDVRAKAPRPHGGDTMDAVGGCFAPGPTGWVSIGNRVWIAFMRRTVNVREKSKPSDPEWGRGRSWPRPHREKASVWLLDRFLPKAAPICVCEALSGIRVNRRNPKTMFGPEKKNGSKQAECETTQISRGATQTPQFSNLFHVSGRERKVEPAAAVCQSEPKLRIPAFHPGKEKYSCSLSNT